jgi:dihydromonapterin reductase/dihydrofolate reductase
VNSGHTLITGVGRRAGLHLARAFLERGQPVVGTYRTRRPALDELEALGAQLHRCDFHARDDVERVIEKIRSDHADLRGIIHNASQWMSDSADVPAHVVVETMMRVHVGVPYELNHALAPLLLACKAPHADIIHVGDYVSGRGSTRHMAYAASKAAQDNLTLSFAAKLAPKVKVNTIAPALLMFNESDPPDYREKALAKSLMQREGGLGELLRTVDYLFDSAFVTGRILPLDGGRHLR